MLPEENRMPKTYEKARRLFEMRILVSHPHSIESQFDETFRTDNSLMLPEENRMPKTYEEARRLIEPFLLPLEKYDCCVFKTTVRVKMYRGLQKGMLPS